jgi:signal transduction histidine kinase
VSLPATDAAGPGRRLPLRPLSIVVLMVVAAIAVAGFVVTRQVVRDQERKLVKQRTDEAGIALGAIGPQLQSALSLVSTTAALHPGNDAAFNAIAGPLTTSTPKVKAPYKTVALIRTTPTPTIVEQAGRTLTGLAPEQSAAVAQAERALADPKTAQADLVGTSLFGPSDVRHLGFAFASPLLPGFVVYAEADVRPGDPTPVTAGAPFSELAVAVYVGTKPVPDQLVISTAGGYKLPLSGNTASVTAPVGIGQPWLMVAKARHPLVGSVATATPWALLAAGLLAALLATAIVETLSRRREYALEVADARTKELKQSLEELAAAHEQLVRQERLAAIGELASTIGHELRNPLGVISNALYLLRADIAKAPSEPASRHLSTAEREVSAATVIVSDLLEFARQRDPVMTDVDTVALVDEVLSVLPPPSGVSVERRPAPGPVVAVADRDMLRQVLLNVVGNGYQAMPEGGTLTVSVGEDDAGAQLRISDSGVGMNDDVRHKLFEPFFTTKARGVGLGLAVCKRIIDAHGGTITVDSEPGAGATFTVTIPQVRVPRQTPAPDRLAAESLGAEL